MKLLTLLVGMVIASTSFASSFTVSNYKRHLELIGVVQDNALELANKINDLSIESSDEITLLINSPGGNVNTGMILIDSMRQAKARGVKFRCISTVLSASMAYITLAECDDRYAFSNTLLLWHEISLSVRGAKVRDLYNTLPPVLELQARVDSDLIEAMKVSQPFYEKHSKSETMWTASELIDNLDNNGFIKLVDRADFKTKNLYKYMEDSPFGFSFTGYDSVDRVLKRLNGIME